jgi:hypothetical protein
MNIYDLFDKTISISIQVLIISVFLITFFFLYVVNVEEEEFKQQIELVMDSILKDPNVSPYLKIPGNDDNMLVAIYGALDAAEEKIKLANKSDIDNINNSNSMIKTNTFIIAGLSGLVLLLIIFLLLSFDVKISIIEYIKHSLIILIFIALTEYIFLTFIGKKYISVSPTQVRKQLAQSILDYIKDRQKN